MPDPNAVAGAIKAIGDVVSLIFHPQNIKLREELRRLASYKKACIYAQEYMKRDGLILSTDDKKFIAKCMREKETLQEKFTKTLIKN